MIRNLTATFLVLGFLCSALKAADFPATEQIGRLRIGLTEAELLKAIECKLKRGPESLWGADGAYHQTWQCPACGLSLGMTSKKHGGDKVIESITVTPPCTLTTSRGIRIGSPVEDVRKAYKKEWNRVDSGREGSFVAGSIYGGMIFDFENGTVSRIFLGAAAE